MNTREKKIYKVLTDIQADTFGENPTVLSCYPNGDISFGVYGEIQKLWYFNSGFNDNVVDDMLDEVRQHFGLYSVI